MQRRILTLYAAEDVEVADGGVGNGIVEGVGLALHFGRLQRRKATEFFGKGMADRLYAGLLFFCLLRFVAGGDQRFQGVSQRPQPGKALKTPEAPLVIGHIGAIEQINAVDGTLTNSNAASCAPPVSPRAMQRL